MATDQQTIATLAAAIVIVRKATSVVSIQNAWKDARFIVYPDPANKEYKEWQRLNSLISTTPEEDQAALESRQRLANEARKLMQR